MASFFNPKVMEQVQGTPESLRWFRSRCGSRQELADDLFLYRHRRTMKFMLAAWLPGRQLFTPILELGNTPDLSDAVVTKFKTWLHPDPEQTVEAALQQAAGQERQAQEDLNAERVEARTRLLRDGMGIKVRHEDGGVFAPADMLRG
jgi:hypothetical protein